MLERLYIRFYMMCNRINWRALYKCGASVALVHTYVHRYLAAPHRTHSHKLIFIAANLMI